jgi:hypothetical protein|tara:strand:+ start:333 stop:629 length:297 start_codon:yes stop_codon:yes gene_type:complete
MNKQLTKGENNMRYEQKAELQDSNKARIYEARMYEEKKKEINTDKIYSTALVYACYSGGPKTVNSYLIEKMFNDLINLSDEYSFDYKNYFKQKRINNE